MSSFNGSRRQCVIPPIVYSTLQQLGRLSQDGFLGTLVDVLGLNYIWLRKLSILHLQVLVSSNSLCFLFFKSDKLIDKPPLGESRKKVTIHKLDGIAWSFLTVTWPLLQLLGHQPVNWAWAPHLANGWWTMAVQHMTKSGLFHQTLHFFFNLKFNYLVISILESHVKYSWGLITLSKPCAVCLW